MFVRGPRAKIFSVRNDHGKGSAPGARGMRRAETGETERTTDVLIDSRGPVARYIPPDASPREGVSSNLPAKNDNLSQTGISAERRRASCSCAMLTWTLDALRAATEPVKEEAMQAIFVGCVLGGVQRTCAGMAQMKRGPQGVQGPGEFTPRATRPSRFTAEHSAICQIPASEPNPTPENARLTTTRPSFPPSSGQVCVQGHQG